MIPEAAAAAVIGAAGVLAYGVRAPSSTLLAPSVRRGPRNRKAVALTFDDGPSESTAQLLDTLASHSAKCTFFQCGAHAERLPAVSRLVLSAGHEIGNHTYSHSPLYLRHPRFVEDEVALGQQAIEQATGAAPQLFRAPYGARWFGLRRAQARFRLLGVMWTSLALDWKLDPARIIQRLKKGIQNGAIFCLHDGRAMTRNPDIGATIEAVRGILPVLRNQGFELITVSELICRKTSPSA